MGVMSGRGRPVPAFGAGIGVGAVPALGAEGVGEELMPAAGDEITGNGDAGGRGAGVAPGEGASGLGVIDAEVPGTGSGDGFGTGVTALGVAEAEGGLGGGANSPGPCMGKPVPPGAGTTHLSAPAAADSLGVAGVPGAGVGLFSPKGLGGGGVGAGFSGTPPGAAVFRFGEGNGTAGLESLFFSSSSDRGAGVSVAFFSFV